MYSLFRFWLNYDEVLVAYPDKALPLHMFFLLGVFVTGGIPLILGVLNLLVSQFIFTFNDLTYLEKHRTQGTEFHFGIIIPDNTQKVVSKSCNFLE